MHNHLNRIKKLYEKSIFVDNLDEILQDNDYINRYDEWIVKEIGIGYLMIALNSSPEITTKLTKQDILDLIYTIVCFMDSLPFTEAIEESKKYNLRV